MSNISERWKNIRSGKKEEEQKSSSTSIQERWQSIRASSSAKEEKHGGLWTSSDISARRNSPERIANDYANTLGDIESAYSSWQDASTMTGLKTRVNSVADRLNAYNAMADAADNNKQIKKGKTLDSNLALSKNAKNDIVNQAVDSDIRSRNKSKSIANNYSKQADNVGKLADYYSQFESADEFNTTQKYGGKKLTFEEVQKALEDDSISDYERNYLENYGINGLYTNLSDYDKEIEARKKNPAKEEPVSTTESPELEALKNNPDRYLEYTELKNAQDNATTNTKSQTDLDKLKAARNRYALDNKFDYYKGYLNAPDIEAKGVYDSSVGNLAYQYINGGEDAAKKYISTLGLDNSSAVTENAKAQSYENYAKYLTEDEKKVYSYLATTDPAKADKFLKDMRITVDKRMTEADALNAQTIVNNSNAVEDIIGSMGTVLPSIAGGIISGIANIGDRLMGNEVNPYQPASRLSNFMDSYRQAVSDKIEQNSSSTWSFLYNTGMSMLDSLTGAGIATLSEGTQLATLGRNLYGASMGLGAGSQRIKELKDQGASDEQAFIGGALSGIAEGFFEEYSLEKLISIKDVDSKLELLKNFLRQSFTEGSEEVFTEIANMIIDEINRGDLSDYHQKIDSYMAQGMSESEAKAQAIKDSAMNVALAGLGGAISGGVMGGVKSTFDYASNKSTGKSAKGLVSDSRLVEAGKNLPEDNEFYKKAQKYNADKLTNAQRGSLLNNVGRETVSASMNVLNDENATEESRINAVTNMLNLNRVAKSESERSADEGSKGIAVGENSFNGRVINTFVKDGENYIKTSDGTEIKFSDATMTQAYKDVVGYASQIDNMTERMEFLSNYDGKTDLNSYTNAFDYVYQSGVLGLNKSKLSTSTFSQEQIDEIYASGRELNQQLRDAEEKSYTEAVKAAQKPLTALLKTFNPNNTYATGTFDTSDTDGIKLNEEQTVALDALKQIYEAASLPVNIKTFASKTDAEGNFNAEQGWYDEATNTIHVDVYAGYKNLSEGSTQMVQVMSHELTHWAESKAPTTFKALSDNVIDSLAAERGVTRDNVIANEIAHLKEVYKNAGIDKEVTRELAISEITARACEDMLMDKKVFDKYTKNMSQNQKRTFVEKVKDLLGKLADLFKSLAERFDTKSSEYKEFARQAKAYDRARAQWASMLEQASRVGQAEQADKYETELLEKALDEKTDDSSVLHALRINPKLTNMSMKAYEKYKGTYAENVNKDMLDAANVIIQRFADYMMPYLDILNNNGKRYLPEEILGKTIHNNGSYQKDVDNTTICFRTLAYIDFTNEVKRMIGRPLSLDESFLASQMLYAIAKDPQCLYCYVSLDRKAYDDYLLKYMKWRDTTIANYRNLEDKSEESMNKLYESFLEGRDSNPTLKKRFNKWVSYAENNSKLIELKDLTTKEVRSALYHTKLGEQIRDAESYAQSSSWAKKELQYRAYNGAILKMSDNTVDSLNEHYGLRFYSFAEYTPAFIVENMQQIRDASIRGLKGLAYTKMVDFAKIFAPTGMNINISVFGKMTKHGVVADTKQGADWEAVKELRNQYKNVGAVFVATSDELVRWAMEQDWIDVVIPFHIVKTGTEVAEFYKWVVYTNQQNDLEGRKSKNILPHEHNNDLDTYNQLIKERGLTRRFEKFYTEGDTNYMKLVNETRQSDAETLPLVPNFTETTYNAAKLSFDTFVDNGGYYGNWYNDGADFRASVETVANDILSGRRANEVDYGRQDIDAEDEKNRIDMLKRNPSLAKHGQKLSVRDSYAPTFYSKMSEVIDDVKNDKLGANSVVSYLKGKGVKDEEIKWSGIQTFLEGKKSVTKAELQEFAKNSMLQIEESQRDMTHWDDLQEVLQQYTNLYVWDYFNYSDEFMPRKLKQDIEEYYEDGDIGKNEYKELIEAIEKADHASVKWYNPKFNTDGGTNYRELVFKMPNSDYMNQAMNVHWEEKGVLAHARMQDFDTEEGKMLFIEEIQSDWHNAGKKNGYTNDYYPISQAEFDAINEERKTYADSKVRELTFDGNEARAEAYNKFVREWNANNKDKADAIAKFFNWDKVDRDSVYGVPDAPFKNYIDFVLKRLIRVAAEEGYDSIGWTTGKMQEQRWSSEYAEGYRIEYDQDMPKFLNKYGKQWGVKVGKSRIVSEADMAFYTLEQNKRVWNLLDDDGNIVDSIIQDENNFPSTKAEAMKEFRKRPSYVTVWSMPITDAMKESVLYKGQPMYSLRQQDVLADITSNKERLRSQNASLQTDAENLAKRLELTTFSKVKAEDIQKYVEKFVTNANLDIDASKVAKRIATIFNNNLNVNDISRGTFQNAVENYAVNLADAIKGAKQTDYKYAKLINTLRTTTIQMSDTQYEDAVRYAGGESNLSRMTFGKMKISTTEGTDLDEFYDGLVKTYPELFSQTSDADKFATLIGAYNDVMDARRIVTSYRDVEATKYLQSEIYNIAWQILGGGKEAEALRLAHSKSMDAMRQTYRAGIDDKSSYAQVVDYFRRETKRKTEVAREYGLKRLERYKDTQARNAEIKKITSKASELMKSLKTDSKDNHVPKVLKTYVANFLESLDFSSKRKISTGEFTQRDEMLSARFSDLSRFLKDAKTDSSKIAEELNGYLDIPEEYLEELDEVSKALADIEKKYGGDTSYVLNQLALDDLKTIRRDIIMLGKVIKTTNNFIANARFRQVSDAAREDISYFNEFAHKRDKNNKVEKLIHWQNTLPYYAFQRFGEGGQAIFESLMDGWDNYAFRIRDILDAKRAIVSDETAGKWAKEVHEITLENGDTIKMTSAQIMSFYCLNRRELRLQELYGEKAPNHLRGGGIHIGDFKLKGKTYVQSETHSLSMMDIANIASKLSDEQRVAAEKLQEFMTTTCSKWGNETSMKRYGIESFTEDMYFPIKVDPNNIASEPSDKENNLFRLLNLGFTKALTKGANNSIMVNDIFDVFSAHSTDMAKYNSLALPVLDAFKWFSFKEKIGDGKAITLKSALDTAFGDDAKGYIYNFLKDINGAQDGGRDEEIGNIFTKYYKVAAVAFNLRVALLQPTAYLRASAVLSASDMAAGFRKPSSSEKAKKYSGIAYWKDLGFFTIDTQRNVQNIIKGEKNIRDKVADAGLWLAGKGDELTWGHIWNACEHNVLKNNPYVTKDSDGFNQLVAKKFREVIYKSQVVDSTMTRTEIMRSKSSLAKLLTAFMSEPSISWNLFSNAVHSFTDEALRSNKSEAWKKTKGIICKSAYAYLITAVGNALAEALIDAFRDIDDFDDDKTWAENFGDKYGDNFWANLVDDMSLLAKLPYIKEAYSVFKFGDMAKWYSEAKRNGEVTGADVKKKWLSMISITYSSSRMDMAVIDSVRKSFVAISKTIANDDKSIDYKTVYTTAQAISHMTGMPLSPLVREFSKLWNNVMFAIGYDSMTIE